ncbi:hypothetical protein JQC72_01440 [Polycladomyces sp. WAk]|uniref:YaaC-like Protein n=1 Tax=Polycladomyces zharkentensis TaxID=2807616 RepID=A0ABS2WF74_9BACL|nr:hypothetical protein [Polycladomyces sp. WAk]
MIQPTEETVWSLFLRLENEPAAKRFLTERYREQGVENAERAAFLSSQPFRYYLKLGRETIYSIRTCDPLIQPLPAYYGMMHLMKALVLSRVPDYPQNTSVLRHGLSTRKRKKSLFRFRDEEVRVQKEGLFPLLLGLFGIWGLTGEVLPLKELWGLIPELQETYRFLYGRTTLYPIVCHDKDVTTPFSFSVSETLLDALHLTPAGWIRRLNEPRAAGNHTFILLSADNGRVSFQLQSDHGKPARPEGVHPWFRTSLANQTFVYSGENTVCGLLPELLVHYAILFALSMLCRYETPLWAEMNLEGTAEETALIRSFLFLVRVKTPLLVWEALWGRNGCFHSSSTGCG